MMELAREKHAAELKTLKENSEMYGCLLCTSLPAAQQGLGCKTSPSYLSSCSDTKEMKKKLEAKRLERIQAMTKVASDKMAQER